MTAKRKPVTKALPQTRKRATTRSRVSLVRPTWSTACPDWQDRIVKGIPLTPCPPLFESSAASGLAIFKRLKIVDAGVTFGDSRPWIMDFARGIFGSYCDVSGHEDEGRRLIKTFFMLISKKNTKSTLAAGIMLTVLIQNWRHEAEYLILSPTKEVADNSFRPMKAAIEADEELTALFHVQPHLRQITHRETQATLKAVAADSQTVAGKKATGVLVDELHEFGKVAKAEDMLVEATGGLMSRPEGFVIYLTTQSSEPPAGVFKKELDYARAIRDGKVVDPSYMPIIYEFPDEYLDPRTRPYLREENWYMVNPNLGVSVDLDTLRQKMMKAGESGEDSLQSIVSKHLNIQIGLDLGADAWPAAEFWPSSALKVTLDQLLDMSEVITAGIDGGGLDDLLALTFTGRVTGTVDRFVSWSRAWAHPSVLERRKEIVPRLRDFEREGDLVIVKRMGQDTEQLAKLMRKVFDTDLLAGIGIDPARIASLKTALAEQNIIDSEEPDPEFFIKVRQGWSLYSAMLWVERALSEGRYKHADQAVVTWSVGNAKVVPRGNALLITKEVSGKAKVDLVMSSLNAAELMSYNPPARIGGYSLDNLSMMG
jgi:phage terminase large subunit-like protein